MICTPKPPDMPLIMGYYKKLLHYAYSLLKDEKKNKRKKKKKKKMKKTATLVINIINNIELLLLTSCQLQHKSTLLYDANLAFSVCF